MSCLETRVIIHEHEQVLKSSMMRAHKRTGDVGVSHASSIGWFIQRGVVCVMDGVGRRAGRTSVETAVSE
eukprot:2633494-Pleurochrysis_carterae.AAC.1